MKQKTLIVIAGPTAIGKTALAIEIAKHFKTEIVSADSRQFFKEMTIGTAKPNEGELKCIKHHFINSHSIYDDVSVGSFEKEAIAKIEMLFLKHDVLVLAGGSGLYINAVLYGFDEFPSVNEDIRKSLNERLDNYGLTDLQKELELVDPLYYAQVDIQNPQRIIRALEVYHSSGKPFSSFRKTELQKRSFKFIMIGLNTDRKILYDRINSRVDQMILHGLLDEVISLKEYKNLNALRTVGYSEIFNYLEGNNSLSEAIELIKQNTRRFAKRQLTWFKKSPHITWFKPNQNEEIISFIEKEMIFTNL